MGRKKSGAGVLKRARERRFRGLGNEGGIFVGKPFKGKKRWARKHGVDVDGELGIWMREEWCWCLVTVVRLPSGCKRRELEASWNSLNN